MGMVRRVIRAGAILSAILAALALAMSLRTLQPTTVWNRTISKPTTIEFRVPVSGTYELRYLRPKLKFDPSGHSGKTPGISRWRIDSPSGQLRNGMCMDCTDGFLEEFELERGVVYTLFISLKESDPAFWESLPRAFVTMKDSDRATLEQSRHKRKTLAAGWLAVSLLTAAGTALLRSRR